MSTILEALELIATELTALGIFSDVVITTGVQIEHFQELNFPTCFIIPGNTQLDQENPEFQKLSVDIGIWTINENDPYGQQAYKDVAALVEAVKTAMLTLGGDDLRWYLVATSQPAPETRSGQSGMVRQALKYEGDVG